MENLVRLIPLPYLHHHRGILQLGGDSVQTIVDGGVGGRSHKDLLARLHQIIDNLRDGEGFACSRRSLDEMEVTTNKGFTDSLVLRRVATRRRRRFAILVRKLSRQKSFEVVTVVGIAVEVFPRRAQQLLGDVGVHRIDFPSVARVVVRIQNVALVLETASPQHEVVYPVLLDFHQEAERSVTEPHLRALAELGDVVFAADAHTVDVAFRRHRIGQPTGRRSIEKLELRMQVGHGVASAHPLLQRTAHEFVVFLVLELLLYVDGVCQLVQKCHSLRFCHYPTLRLRLVWG